MAADAGEVVELYAWRDRLAGRWEWNRLFLFVEGAVAHYAFEGVVGVGLEQGLQSLCEPVWGWRLNELVSFKM